MPKEVFGRGYDFFPKGDVLSFEEITRLSGTCRGGVEKVRLTGGEPLLRRHLDLLIGNRRHRRPPRPDSHHQRLALVEEAAALRAAGLRRLTVSLDSLDDAIFRAMNDVDFPVHRVLCGIDAARAAGFAPIKINMVVKRGVNDDEVVAMARRSAGRNSSCASSNTWTWGTATAGGWQDVVPAAEIIERVGAELPLEPLPRNYPGEIARRYRHRGGRRNRRHRLGHAAILRRLHARAAFRGWDAFHVPLCLARHRVAGLAARRSHRAICAKKSAPCGRGARTATRRFAPRRPDARQKSRCRASAAERDFSHSLGHNAGRG